MSMTMPSSSTDTAVTLVCFTPRIIPSSVVSRTDEGIFLGSHLQDTPCPCAFLHQFTGDCPRLSPQWSALRRRPRLHSGAARSSGQGRRRRPRSGSKRPAQSALATNRCVRCMASEGVRPRVSSR